MGELAPTRSKLGAFVKSALGARLMTAPEPPAGIASRDLVEYITENIGGFQVGAVLRLHGDVESEMSGLDQLLIWHTDHSQSISTGGPTSFVFDPSLTTTVCNGGKVVQTPIGSTTITFAAPIFSGGVFPTARIQTRRGSIGKQGEHWVDLVTCGSFGNFIHYDIGTKVLWGRTFSQGQGTAANEPLCAGGLASVNTEGPFWQFNGDNNPAITEAMAASVLETWEDGQTWDFSGQPQQPSFAGGCWTAGGPSPSDISLHGFGSSLVLYNWATVTDGPYPPARLPQQSDHIVRANLVGIPWPVL